MDTSGTFSRTNTLLLFCGRQKMGDKKSTLEQVYMMTGIAKDAHQGSPLA
jgi:hypothetical protein